MARTKILHGHATGGRDATDAECRDSPGAAEARVALKLAATAYAASRDGSDASERLTRAALWSLRGRAVLYYGQLLSVDLRKELPDHLDALHEDPAVDQAFARLQVVALAYAHARVGADACVELSRSAIAHLCTTAAAYATVLVHVASGGRAPSDRWDGSHGSQDEPRATQRLFASP